MKLKEKLAREYFGEEHEDIQTEAYLAGFEKAREMAALKIRKSVNLEGIPDPSDSLINCSIQSKHDHDICISLGEEEAT